MSLPWDCDRSGGDGGIDEIYRARGVPWSRGVDLVFSEAEPRMLQALRWGG